LGKNHPTACVLRVDRILDTQHARDEILHLSAVVGSMQLKGLRALFDLNEFIGNQTMSFPMNGNCCLFVWRLDETKNLAGILVEPVAQVFDTVLVLRL
jgi:hypothetical protein